MADLATLSLSIDTRPAESAVSALDRLTGSATRADTAASVLTQGAGRTATALNSTGRAATDTASALTKVSEAANRPWQAGSVAERLAKDYERATKAAREYDAATKGITGGGSSLPGPSALPPANDNPTRPRGLTAYDKSFIGYQGFDVASSLGAGASPLTVAFQQGPQVLQQLADRDGGLKQGLKDVGSSLMGLVTPGTAAIGVVTALGLAFGVAAAQAKSDQTVLQNATLGLGRASGNTAEQLDAIARSNATAGRVSTSTAREMVAAYNETGAIGTSVFGTLIQVTERYAQITGQDATSATQELTRTFADIGSGADAIASRIGGLDDKTRQLIQTQIEQGDRSAAQQTLADSLKASIDANTAATGGWAAAWNAATAAANGYWEAAKRIAGIKLGIAPEGAQEAVTRLQTEVDRANAIRAGIGAEPLNATTSSKVRELGTARVIADQQRMEAEGRAAEERANKASTAAGAIARSIDPNTARLSELRTQESTLKAALDDGLTRSKLADVKQTDEALQAVTRARQTLTDTTGKAISMEEMSRRSDQLRIDSLNAKTDAEKKAVAERQKTFDLIGKTITPSDARGQVARAGTISALENADKGSGGGKGGTAERLDDYDRATKRIEDQTRRVEEQTTTFGMGAGAVARYRTEQELLTAAKRADRDITPELTAQISEYAAKSATAATALEQVRQTSQQSFALQSFAGNEIVNALDGMATRGATVASVFSNMTSALTRAALQAAVMGSGPLAGLFGTAAAPGTNAAGGLIGALAGGVKSLFGYADGGAVYGAGTGTSDSILARLSHGEFVVNAAATSRHRGLLEQINGPGVAGFALGGGLLAHAAPSGGMGGPMIIRLA